VAGRHGRHLAVLRLAGDESHVDIAAPSHQRAIGNAAAAPATTGGRLPDYELGDIAVARIAQQLFSDVLAGDHDGLASQALRQREGARHERALALGAAMEGRRLDEDRDPVGLASPRQPAGGAHQSLAECTRPTHTIRRSVTGHTLATACARMYQRMSSSTRSAYAEAPARAAPSGCQG